MPVARARGAKAKADRLFSLIVRARGECEMCGSEHQLQTAHIVSRKFVATRTDLDNAFCLCASCHRSMTDRPWVFGDFCNEMRDKHTLLRIHSKAGSGMKVDWDAEVVRLTNIWETVNV